MLTGSLLAPQPTARIAPGGFRLNAKQKTAAQLLSGPQRHTLIYGGSRSGKTFLFVRIIIIRALKAANSRHVIFRHRFNACRAAVWLDTFPKVMRLCFPGVKVTPHKQEGYVTLPNGSEIWFAGMDDKDRVEKILGMEFATIYLNECSQLPYSSVLLVQTRLAQYCPEIINRMFYDLNPVGTGHWTYKLFIDLKDPDSGRALPDPENYKYTVINPKDNEENLADGYVQQLEAMPERQRKRFLEGRYVAEIDGALWTVELIERQRLDDTDKLPHFTRIVVAIDPSGCRGDSDQRSDEVGVVVAGVVGYGGDGHGYVLEDLSGRHKPEEWARLATSAYHKWHADCVVGETNYGGDMVRAVLHGHDANVPFKMVTATRGKAVRAEPISQLYEMGRIWHASTFTSLEDQYCNFSVSGYLGDKSPDRADAAVWALTELLIGSTETGLLEFYKSEAAKAKAKG